MHISFYEFQFPVTSQGRHIEVAIPMKAINEDIFWNQNTWQERNFFDLNLDRWDYKALLAAPHPAWHHIPANARLQTSRGDATTSAHHPEQMI